MFWIGVGANIVKPPLDRAITSTEYCNLTAFSNSTVQAMLAPVVPHVVERQALSKTKHLKAYFSFFFVLQHAVNEHVYILFTIIAVTDAHVNI